MNTLSITPPDSDHAPVSEVPAAPHGAVRTAMAHAVLNDARAREIFTILAPIRHAESPEGAARYRVEPYVIASDVLAFSPNAWREGRTGYPGSAGLEWSLDNVPQPGSGIALIKDRLKHCLPVQLRSLGESQCKSA